MGRNFSHAAKGDCTAGVTEDWATAHCDVLHWTVAVTGNVSSRCRVGPWVLLWPHHPHHSAWYSDRLSWSCCWNCCWMNCHSHCLHCSNISSLPKLVEGHYSGRTPVADWDLQKKIAKILANSRPQKKETNPNRKPQRIKKPQKGVISAIAPVNLLFIGFSTHRSLIWRMGKAKCKITKSNNRRSEQREKQCSAAGKSTNYGTNIFFSSKQEACLQLKIPKIALIQ